MIEAVAITSREQESADKFYIGNGPCCAGCDWWNRINSGAGECRRSAPVGGPERMAMLGMTSASLAVGPGHPVTLRGHHCGDFRDSFNWSSLPPHYLRRIGWAAGSPQERRE